MEKVVSFPVVEIFRSIDGEGCYSGALAAFIRLAGCNLRCSYCDTKYSFDCKSAKRMTVKEIIETISNMNVAHVTLTGGEPLIHPGIFDLVVQLVNSGQHVNIETNGSIDISQFSMSGVTITMDYKMKSSGEMNKMLESNIQHLRESDVLKLVVSRSDLKDVGELLCRLNPKCQIFISPIFGKVEPVELVETLKSLADNSRTLKVSYQCRVQLQMHKIIWNENTRGV